MAIQSLTSFNKMYEKYSPMLYSIALEIAPTQKEAEEILTNTFVKAHQQNLMLANPYSLCVTLINLIIKTAHEQLTPGESNNNFKLKRFENSPLLHQMLCKQVDLKNYCNENKLTHAEVGLKLREEINLLRDFKNKTMVAVDLPDLCK